MSQVDGRVRSGAKSCAECRRRKIRCVWSSDRELSDERTECDHCLARRRTCIPQLQRRDAGRMTARQRITHLEREMASLSALVREQPSSGSRIDEGEDFYDCVEDIGHEIEDSRPPTHLRLLFDDFDMERDDQRGGPPSTSAVTDLMQTARTKLRPLVPSREEVSRIAIYASDWMTLYHSLFPAMFAFRTGDQLVANYDRMHDYDVSPVTLAMYLLSVAITAQQTPQERVSAGFHHGHGVPRFVNAVCRAVEHTIVSNNTLAGTAEGLETGLLYVRLSLGRGNLNGTWLIFRRIIALAELVGLPQANDQFERSSGQGSEALKLKADVWESICATDRNFSMMLNFPAGTIRYRFPRDGSIWRDGHVSSQAYNYQLSNICAAIFEIDESYGRGDPLAECYEQVLGADRQLRALAALPPKAWWQDEAMSLDNRLVKFWHYYITARVHLRPGMIDSDEYAYSRTACWDACQNAARRFVGFRLLVPAGFFVCRVIDVQAFTAATFLLLSRPQGQPVGSVDAHTLKLVQDVVECFRSLRDQTGSDLAREAMDALSSLIAIVHGRSGQSKLIIQIPLLGKVHIRVPGTVPESVPLDSGHQHDNFGKEAAGQLTQDGSSGPVSWFLEFDDSLLWGGSSLPPDNVPWVDC